MQLENFFVFFLGFLDIKLNEKESNSADISANRIEKINLIEL